jgi:hypothetical protein
VLKKIFILDSGPFAIMPSHQSQQVCEKFWLFHLLQILSTKYLQLY